jgi:hypothetical protein
MVEGQALAVSAPSSHAATTKAWTPPRTPDGQPDLQPCATAPLLLQFAERDEWVTRGDADTQAASPVSSRYAGITLTTH